MNLNRNVEFVRGKGLSNLPRAFVSIRDDPDLMAQGNVLADPVEEAFDVASSDQDKFRLPVPFLGIERVLPALRGRVLSQGGPGDCTCR